MSRSGDSPPPSRSSRGDEFRSLRPTTQPRAAGTDAALPCAPSSAGPEQGPGSGGRRGIDRALENVDRLRATVKGVDEGMRAFTRAVEARLDLVAEYASGASKYIAELEQRVAKLEQHNQELEERVDAASLQSGRLVSLYVATYQLHATLDPAMVQKVIGEIVINLLGSERFALLLRQEAVSTCELAFSEGLTAEDRAFFGPDGYCGGDTLIDEALAEGRVVVGQTEGSRAIAAAPLRMQDQTIGMLVILELLGHKKELTGDDCELLELLASHAASAWVLAQMHASVHRKLKTLEELVRLVPRPAPGAQAGLDPLDLRPSGGHEPRR